MDFNLSEENKKILENLYDCKILIREEQTWFYAILNNIVLKTDEERVFDYGQIYVKVPLDKFNRGFLQIYTIPENVYNESQCWHPHFFYWDGSESTFCHGNYPFPFPVIVDKPAFEIFGMLLEYLRHSFTTGRESFAYGQWKDSTGLNESPIREEFDYTLTFDNDDFPVIIAKFTGDNQPLGEPSLEDEIEYFTVFGDFTQKHYFIEYRYHRKSIEMAETRMSKEATYFYYNSIIKRFKCENS
jgi:hypothetical protein